MLPLVSVIIPTFNNARLIGETLDGIRDQTFCDFEVVVVDDGSTDDTANVLKAHELDIVYHYQSNKGPAAARNRGAALAKGEYLAFCDHDDIWNKGHLEALLAGIKADASLAMVFDNAEYFGSGVSSKLHLDDRDSQRLVRGKVESKFLLWRYPVASMSVTMVRKKHFQRIGGLNETIGVMDDYHLYLRLGAAWDIRYVDFIGCKKRVSESNLSRVTNIKEMNLRYLEDLYQNHDTVIRDIGAINFRLRLGRKYFNLGRYYRQSAQKHLASTMFWKAFTMNRCNFRYILHYLRTQRSK